MRVVALSSTGCGQLRTWSTSSYNITLQTGCLHVVGLQHEVYHPASYTLPHNLSTSSSIVRRSERSQLATFSQLWITFQQIGLEGVNVLRYQISWKCTIANWSGRHHRGCTLSPTLTSALTVNVGREDSIVKRKRQREKRPNSIFNKSSQRTAWKSQCKWTRKIFLTLAETPLPWPRPGRSIGTVENSSIVWNRFAFNDFWYDKSPRRQWTGVLVHQPSSGPKLDGFVLTDSPWRTLLSISLRETRIWG